MQQQQLAADKSAPEPIEPRERERETTDYAKQSARREYPSAAGPKSFVPEVAAGFLFHSRLSPIFLYVYTRVGGFLHCGLCFEEKDGGGGCCFVHRGCVSGMERSDAVFERWSTLGGRDGVSRKIWVKDRLMGRRGVNA